MSFPNVTASLVATHALWGEIVIDSPPSTCESTFRPKKVRISVFGMVSAHTGIMHFSLAEFVADNGPGYVLETENRPTKFGKSFTAEQSSSDTSTLTHSNVLAKMLLTFSAIVVQKCSVRLLRRQ
jgi:hypothetical protein